MGYCLKIADANSQKNWDDCVKSSPHGTIFHTWQWLKIMEKHSNSTLYPVQIFKGSTHIANYPIFFKRKGHFRFALSPVNNVDCLYLGPVLPHYDSSGQKKKEDHLAGIQTEIDRFLFSELKCHYARLRTAPGIPDARALLWSGYHVEPNYTYRLDLSADVEDLWNRLHKTIRTSINSARKKGVVVEKGVKNDVSFIESEIKRRFFEQGVDKADLSPFLLDIFDAYDGRNLEITTAKYNGKTVSGIMHLSYDGIVYQWVGVPKSNISGLSPNELLVWESIISARENGQRYYEFMDGGSDPRLGKFKSKFNPNIWIWYSAEKYSHPAYELARTMFQKFGYQVRI